MQRFALLPGILFFGCGSLLWSAPQLTLSPLVRVVDLGLGESTQVELCDGTKVQLKLLDLQESRDSLRDAVRVARVQVEIDGRNVWLTSGNYNLPVTTGKVQIDCPITKGPTTNSDGEHWGLETDARLRLWPAGSPFFVPSKFVYPVKQRWFASATQMANEPVYNNGEENPKVRKIYYHYGLDFGGAEILTEVVAATDGLVVSAGTTVLPGYKDTPVAIRYDVIYLLDAQGWCYRYSTVVVVAERDHPERSAPALHVAYYPSLCVHAGDSVTFKARMFGTTQGAETWDFGDGTPPATTHSNRDAERHAKDGYAVITHRYERPGDYLVRVERRDDHGWPAIGRVHVPVGADSK